MAEERTTRREKKEEELHARYRLNPVTGETETVMPGDPGYDNLEPTPEQVTHYQEAAESEPDEHRAATSRRARNGGSRQSVDLHADAKPDAKADEKPETKDVKDDPKAAPGHD